MNSSRPHEPLEGSTSSPPPFAWTEWYAARGGRTIAIEEVNEILRKIYEEQYPRFEGVVADRRAEFLGENGASEHLKAKAREFGADLVGICEIEPTDIYRGKSVDFKYAIVVGAKMLWREYQVVPSDRSAVECLRVYHSLGETVVSLANEVRRLGYDCKVEHPIGDSDVLHIPLGLKAGFGELGRHGSIINPTLGPLFRMGCVITSMPLALDEPIDAGIAKFCDKCRACRIYCPANAIPDHRNELAGKDHLGNDRYIVDTDKCFPYFAKHNYCSICLPVCVYNHKAWARDFEGHETKLFPEIIMEDPEPIFISIPAELRH